MKLSKFDLHGKTWMISWGYSCQDSSTAFRWFGIAFWKISIGLWYRIPVIKITQHLSYDANTISVTYKWEAEPPCPTNLIGDIEKLLELVDRLSTWTPGLPPAPGTYAVRTIGAKMLPTCMEIKKPEGDWSTLEWVKLPE